MNVGELKKLIQNIPDDVLVVGPDEDHSYRRISMIEGDAEATCYLVSKSGRVSYTHLSECYYPDEIGEDGTVIPVLIFY